MLSILEMLVKFSLQFNFLDRRLKNVVFSNFRIFVKYRVRQQFLCTATTNFPAVPSNRWEIYLRMRYNLRGLRERDLGRVNIVI